VGEDPTGKLPAAFQWPTHSEKKANSGTPKLSFLPITDAVRVKGQLQQAGSVETLYFPGDALQ